MKGPDHTHGIFTGLVTVQAVPFDETTPPNTAHQLGVTLNGESDAHGFGHALGTAMRAWLNDAKPEHRLALKLLIIGGIQCALNEESTKVHATGVVS